MSDQTPNTVDMLEWLGELRSGMVKPDWYNADIAIGELARRLLEAEERLRLAEARIRDLYLTDE